MSTTIRAIEPADAESFRALRLEALARHPCAFSASDEEEAMQPIDAVAARLERGTVLGGFAAGELVGVAGLAIPELRKKRHKGVLWGVYVRAEVRGLGLGRALVESVIAHARGRVAQLHTTVVTTNQVARRLYHSLGFRPYGIEPRGLLADGRYFDQELLALMLDG